MKSWKEQIPGAFGAVNKKFAGHPLDAERALKLLVSAIEEGVSYDDYIRAVRDWLVARGCCDGFVNEQMAKVQNVGSYFPA